MKNTVSLINLATKNRKKIKPSREMQYLHIRQMMDDFIHDPNLQKKKIPKTPIQLLQINTVTSAVRNHCYSLFESLEAKLSGSFCK